jgi:RND family efflux transporter MFP subunit
MFVPRNKGSLLPKLALMLVVLAGLAIAAFFVLQGTARVAVVKRDIAADAVTGSVIVDADGGIRELKSQAGGTVIWCEAITPDHKFAEGDILVELDSAELKRAMEKTRRSYEQEKKRAEIRLKGNYARTVAAETLENAKRLNQLGAVAEEDVRKAERALNEIETNLKLNEFNDEQAEIEFNAAMIEMEAQLARMTVRAPMDGRVEGALTWKGALIGAGQPVARIFSNDRVVAVKISEENFGRVRVGQLAKLRLLTYGNDSYEATVSKLLPTADDAQRFTVFLDVKVDPELLKPGSTGEATITIEQRENAQVIPRRALINNDQVLVVKDGRVERRNVQVGFVALNVVEVLGGLQDGEHVIVEDQEQFRPGSRVRVAVVN